jgi:hypothetical protein
MNGMWIAILFLVLGTTLSWMVFHFVVDLGRWFKEEIIDDIRDHRKKTREKKQAEIRAQENG